MKRSIFAIGMVCLLTMPCTTFAQLSGDVVSDAIDILKGKTVGKSTEWAIETLKNVEDKHKAKAQNALGIVYLKGIGVSQDSAQVITFFEEAGRLGNADAYYNLGKMMKDAPRRCQNFARAVHYFEKGAELGNLACCYAAGYMYYKGFGCTQDYSRAVAYFKKDLKGNSPSCQYMLGLCYRNGFGVEMDTQKAEDILQKAALNNYILAIEETIRDKSEVENVLLLSDKDEYIPESMPDVEPFMNIESNLAGEYKGVLVTYDWSGRQIVRNENIEISFSKTGNEYHGSWIQGKDTIPVTAKLTDDDRLTFTDTKIRMTDHYRNNGKINCIFDDATLALVGTSLTGSLRMFSYTDNEPLRPMYLALSRDSDNETVKDPYLCAIKAYPIPGSGQIEVCFVLPEDVTGATVSLTSQNGLFAKSYKLGPLSAGQQRLTISTNLTHDVYVVNVKAGKYHGHSTILLNK